MNNETDLLELFDTKHATKTKIHVSINIKFYARLEHVDRDGNSLLYLYLSSGGKKKLISLGIHVPASLWDKETQRISTKKISVANRDINLLIDNIQKRVTEIKIEYRLNNRILTLDRFEGEYRTGFSRIDFIQFATRICEREKSHVAAGTTKKRLSVIEKIRLFKKNVEFGDITIDWINDYKKFWLKDKEIEGKFYPGNNLTTVGSDMKAIKKWLKIAKNYSISLNVNIEDIKVDRTTGIREYLTKNEMVDLYKYYKSSAIKQHHKISLGLFLFSCFTSLRISDVKKIKREDLKNPMYKFKITKTKKQHMIKFNSTALEIANENPKLFVDWKSEQKINEDLKEIMAIVEIPKHITFHCARHTFATNFLRLGGKVEVLQGILMHSRIDETMVYVHIVEAEKDESIFLMDNLFN